MAVTVQDVIDRILGDIPGERLERTVDTMKAGDPDTTVRAVVTTFMATVDVIRKTIDLGANLIITHEPTYWQGRDDTSVIEGDEVLAIKRRLINENDIAIWRFHDYWHRHQPDGIITGVVRRLGWEAYQDVDEPRLFVIPQTTVGELAAYAKEKLNARAVRVTGDPSMTCTNVALVVGAPGSARQIEALRRDDVEVLLGGETREWETCEYVRDAVAVGKKKALILAGHCNSEEAGMEYLVDWLGERMPELNVTFVPAGDPFWSV